MKNVLFLIALLFATVTSAQNAPRPQLAYPFDNAGLQTSVVTRQQGLLSQTYYGDALSGSTINNGGARLVATQYTNGAWGWPLNAPPTYLNTLGPIAKGLVQAYVYTLSASQLTSISKSKMALLSKTNNFSPSDGYLAKAIDEVYGNTACRDRLNTYFYGPLAAGTYNRNGLGTLYNTASYINLIRISRTGSSANMAAWDLGLGLVGAASCGAAAADWIAGVKAEINELDGGNYYDVIGLAGALYGLAFVDEDFDPTAGVHASASNLQDLAAILASYQIELGGFAWNSNYVIPNDGNETIQETGYAILALSEVNRSYFITNILGAADYMAGVQLSTGGWENYSGNGENNEITGEALWGYTIAYSTVENATKGTWHMTIPAAINAASAGDVINVGAGTYAGNIIVNKSLTILGDPGDALPGPGENAPVIDGGSLPGDAFKIVHGVTNLTIKGFEMRNFTSPLMNGIGNGISAWVGSTSNITIQDNYFHHLGYNGVLVGNDKSTNPAKWGDHSNWLIKNNIIGNFGYIGFELTNTSNSNIEDNIIHLATPYIGAIFSSARRTESGLTVKNNQIDGTPSTAYPVIYIYAYDLDMPNPNLNNVLIEGNTIATIGTPYQIYIRNIGTGTVTGVTVVNNNLFSLKNLTSAVIDATCNWWGSTVPATIASQIFGSVTYMPWLTSGEDGDPATGFQPEVPCVACEELSCGITALPGNGPYTGDDPNIIYLGYGPQTVTLSSAVSGGIVPTYSWSPATGLSCTTCASPVFTPISGGNYIFTLTVTNSNGCTTTCTVEICVLDIRVPGSNGNKVYLCHVPPGNPNNSQTLSVNVNSVPAHVPGHPLDHLGTCAQSCGAGPQGGVESGELIVSEDHSISTIVYPNPFSNDFTVTVETESIEPIQVIIYDLTGRLLQEVKDILPNTPVTVANNLQDGIYILYIQQGDQKQKVKIIKHR